MMQSLRDAAKVVLRAKIIAVQIATRRKKNLKQLNIIFNEAKKKKKELSKPKTRRKK